MVGYNNLLNKKTKAVALGYDKEEDIAPRVVAIGDDIIANKIIQIAEENNIPIHRDEDLVKTLSMLELDSYIPLELYSAVAKIISYIHDKDKKYGK